MLITIVADVHIMSCSRCHETSIVIDQPMCVVRHVLEGCLFVGARRECLQNLVTSDNVFEYFMHVNSKVDLCIKMHHGRSS